MSSELAGKQSTLSGPSSGAVARDPSHSQLCGHSRFCYRRRLSCLGQNPSAPSVRWHLQSRDHRHLGLRETGSRPWLPCSFRHVFPRNGRGGGCNSGYASKDAGGSTKLVKASEALLGVPFTVLISRSRYVVAKGPFAHPSICFGRADPRNVVAHCATSSF